MHTGYITDPNMTGWLGKTCCDKNEIEWLYRCRGEWGKDRGSAGDMSDVVRGNGQWQKQKDQIDSLFKWC